MHNLDTMALLWNPESWPQRLAELEAQSGDLKEAPLRRDVRSLGMLLGEVLREQAGEELFVHVEALRQGTIRRRDAEAHGKDEEANRQGAGALALIHSLPVERAVLLTRAFAFYFELINLAETNHRKRRRIALRLSGDAGRQRGSLAGTLCEMRRVGIGADEALAYDPRSPYSASKASSDHLVRAYNHTYGLPTVISNCSNNYGPFQFPEKLIPLAIHNIKNSKLIPVYGKGENIRDWLFVEDHANAIDLIFHNGKIAETYNIGGHNEWKNIDLIHLLCEIMDRKLKRSKDTSLNLITYVKDRAGHDLRYAIDSSKIQKELGWSPSLQFAEGLEKTVEWYLANEEWMKNVTTGDYQKYYDRQYVKR